MPDEHAQYILRAMIDAVVVVDIDDRIFVVNDAISKLLGYSRDELMGARISDIFADPDAAVRSTTRMQVVAEGAELHREEVQFRAKDGSVIPVSLTGSAMLDAGGDLAGIVFVARDLRETQRLLATAEAAARAERERAAELEQEIARRKRAEAELERAKASVEEELDRTRRQLLHADRLATLGTLAGGLGHELSNVAQVFVGGLDRVDEMAASGSFPTHLARAFARAARHLVEHSERLLDLARPGPDYDEPHDLREIITDTVHMLNGAGKTKYVKVESRLPDDAVVVAVNRTRIEQILVNLMVNAVDALTEVPSSQRRVEVQLLVDDEACRAICSVGDNGCGIEEADLATVFEPFYSTKAPGRGTGLGLAVVRQIVESYGGTIGVRSRPERGTTFTFDLPVDRQS